MQWQDVVADATLRNLPYKIELNQQGKIEMSPTSFLHSYFQGEIASALKSQLGGHVFTELAIKTSKGVKIPDVAWSSTAYFAKHRHELCATAAPEICIEILSQSNTLKEMRNKAKIYFASGAIEVWLIDEKGHVRYYDHTGEQPASRFNAILDKLL